MSGTKEGAAKARKTNLNNNPDFYKQIGSKSWDDPSRSHEVGFALNRELASNAGKKGGKKTKSEYKTKNTDEEIGVQAKVVIRTADFSKKDQENLRKLLTETES